MTRVTTLETSPRLTPVWPKPAPGPSTPAGPLEGFRRGFQSPQLMKCLRFNEPFDLTIQPDEQAAYEANNQEMAKKYPGLALILKDPDAFLGDMRNRFDEQKKLTPNDPYSFDFSEYGLPFLKNLAPKIEGKIEALRAEQEQLHNSFFLCGRQEKIKDRGVGIEFLQALKIETELIREQGSVSYKQIQEIGHFASYALGHFDEQKLSLPQRAFLEIDRHIEGHEDVSIQQQFRRYQQGDFSVFQARAGSEGYARVENRYVQGFSNPHKLEMINLPALDEVENDIFMRMMNHPIYIAGVTDNPIPADGFVRPGGDFFLHDVRHNSGIFVEREEYIERNQMSPERVAKLDKRSELWYREYTQAVDKISDPGLKGAVDLVSFNFHHDRGHLMMPSNYLKDGAGSVPRALYAALRISGQGETYGVGKKMPSLDRAHEWLQKFWLDRLDQEHDILGHPPVPNPHL